MKISVIISTLGRKKELEDLLFYHPQSILDYDSISAFKRVFNYRLGFAYVCIKHSLYLKYLKRLFFVFHLIPLCFFVNRRKYKY